MSVSDETILFNTNVDEGENRQAAMILQEVYSALKEAGQSDRAAGGIPGFRRTDLYHQPS